MVTLLVLYGRPKDEAAFEAHYFETHLPLARAIPGLRRLRTARGVSIDAADPPYYRAAWLCFDDMDSLRAGLESDEGRASGADAESIATGGITRTVLHVDPSTD